MGNCCTKFPDDDDEQSHMALLASGNVHLVTTIESWEEKLSEANRDGKLVVANFSASWCGPCRMLAPAYCELADKYTNVLFLTVDVDVLAEFSTSWDIKATPTFFFLKDGREVDKFVGANKVELQKKLVALLDSTSRKRSSVLL